MIIASFQIMITMPWNRKQSSPGNLKILQRRFTTVNLSTEKINNGMQCAEEAGDKNENDGDIDDEGGRLSSVQLSDHADEAPKEADIPLKTSRDRWRRRENGKELDAADDDVGKENVAKRMLAHKERKKGYWTKIRQRW